MEKQYVAPIDGVEVEIEDFDTVSQNAALGDDRVFSELLRMTPSSDNSTVGQRGILPASKTPTGTSVSAIVVPSSAADARVKVLPFRAFIMLPTTLALDAYKNARSAVCAASGNVVDFLTSIGPFANSVQHAAATNNRWDLIYVRIDTDSSDATQTRYVKDDDDNTIAETLVITKQTRATIGVVQGTEATTPARPNIPADSAGAYFIPIAYVLLLAGHALTTAIPVGHIDEVATLVHLHRATGAASLRVANGAYSLTGFAEGNAPWTVANGRPKAYLPPTMRGKEELKFGLHLDGTLPSIGYGLTQIIDDSTDWRNRDFIVRAAFASRNSFNYQLPWNGGVPFPTSAVVHQLMAQSFTATSGSVADLGSFDNSVDAAIAAGGAISLFVDMTDGKIKCAVGATHPVCVAQFWIEATGRFDNAF